MSIRFIYGRSGSGKSHFCLTDILEKLKKDINIPIYIIVPEQFSLQTEIKVSQIIEKTNTLKLNSVEVLSFKRLTYKIFNEAGGPPCPMLNKTGKRINLYRAIKGINHNLTVYKDCEQKQGYIEELANTISELKRYNIDSKDFSGIKEYIKGEKSYNKIKDLSLIYNEYERILSGQYLDPDDEMNILYDKIDKSKMFDNSHIYFDEFVGFTPQQLNIITKLLQKVNQLNFTICSDYLYSDTDTYYLNIFSIPRITVDKIRLIAENTGELIEKPVFLDNSKRFNNEELRHLEKGMFSFEYQQYEKDLNHIKLYAASNQYEEVTKAAKEIINLCREKGYRYRDIGIIVGALGEYEKIIKVIFSEYNIPFFIDTNKDVFTNKLIILLLSALEIKLNNWSYNSVFRYLKTGLLNISLNKIDLLENFIIATGIKGYQWYTEEIWAEKVEYIKQKKIFTEIELKEVNETRTSIIKPLVNLFNKLNNSNCIKENVIHTYEFLEEIQIVITIQKIINDSKLNGNINLANEYSRVWDIICTIFEEIYNHFDSDERVDIKSYYDILKTTISSCELTLIPESVDQVNVGDVVRSKNKEVKALFVLGANDGKLPAPVKDNGMIPDKIRNKLLEKKIELAPNSKIKTVEGNYQIYNALTKSQCYLYVYFSLSDLSGKALRSSILISMIKNMFLKLKIESDKFLDSDNEILKQISLPLPYYKELIFNIRQACQEKKISKELVQICRWYYLNDNWSGKIQNMFRNFNYTNNVDNLSKNTINTIIPSSFSTSITKIQQFVQCPFSYFLKYMLQVKERESFELTYLDIGSLVHEVLEITLSKIDFDKEYNIDDITDICCKVVEKEIIKDKNKIFLANNKNKYLLARNIGLLSRTIYVMYTHLKNSQFKPLGYEFNFKPLSLNIEDNTLKIKGVIDRVDFYEDHDNCYIRIIDYKTGKKKLSLNDIYCGHNLQLTIYLNALIKNGLDSINKNVVPCGILYFNMHNPIVKTDGEDVESEELERRIIKELKMDGIVTDNVEILKAMDSNIEKDSVYLPAKFKKNGELHKISSAINTKQFKILCGYSQKFVENIYKRIIKGEINIYPYKKRGSTPCTYCNYKSICQFDITINGNKYNIIPQYKDEEIWEKMKNNY